MLCKAINTLTNKLSPHIALSKSRLETLCCMVIGMASARTVNLTHLASEMPGEAQINSNYRRLQRFFQHVNLGGDWSARLVVDLLGLTGPWYLCLDRTNWKIGRKEVNILMLAIATKRFRVPLIWTVLDKAGNSNMDERIVLMKRYLALFDVSTIKLLLCDREFVGLKWMNFLNKNNVPFAIRMKENQKIVTEDGACVTLKSFLGECRREHQFQASLPGRNGEAALKLNFAAQRIKGGELLIVASNVSAGDALKEYRKRWSIECLFGDAKTRGFNLEDTRLLIPEKLSLLLALVALAIAWASKTAAITLGDKEIKVKKHGYRAKSWFRVGFDELRKMLRNEPLQAIAPWLEMMAARERVV